MAARSLILCCRCFLPEICGHNHGLVGEKEDAPLQLKESGQVVDDGEDQ